MKMLLQVLQVLLLLLLMLLGLLDVDRAARHALPALVDGPYLELSLRAHVCLLDDDPDVRN